MTTTRTPRAKGEAKALGARQLDPGVSRFLKWLPTLVVFLIAFAWLIPAIGLLVASLRNWGERQQAGWWTDVFTLEGWTLGAYRAALNASLNNSFLEGMFNSFAIAIPATLIPLLIAAWAAYAIIWMPFRGRTFVFFSLVALLAIPAQVVLIPLLQGYATGVHLTLPLVDKTMTLFPDIGLAGTLPAVWLTHIGLAIPFAVFLLAISMLRLPQSLVDSARVDGASHSQIFWRIVLPLSAPALAALGVLLFLWSWNDFLIALTMIGGSNPAALPATVKLGSIGVAADGPAIAAGAFIHSSVAIAVFLVLERYFVKGILISAD